jgi:hypothetical protein
MHRSLLLATAALALATSAFAQERTPSPEGAKIVIISPEHGETLSNPVTVVFGIEGMEVAPAGTEQVNTGQHHLLIDTDLPPMDEPIPADDNHVHFGKGQTETEIELTPGEHSLQLLLGDLNHIPHDPPVMSETIIIGVE